MDQKTPQEAQAKAALMGRLNSSYYLITHTLNKAERYIIGVKNLLKTIKLEQQSVMDHVREKLTNRNSSARATPTEI